ncbi:hypothetical protein L210DRAFT_939929 [Boletus edulis BED1]|uniref:Uncharacterized protein n=1 Tax=Boletus edulis BED1 TaxID=1328754 RepID=A0AAD4C4C6_BOLED|nr:hypothetical protein L210DRAFT_939929 [Boletus edulis BED1]
MHDDSSRKEPSSKAIPTDRATSEKSHRAEKTRRSPRHYRSYHSSRSSSFNESSAEIILGLFRQDVVSEARSSGLDLEGKDPAVRNMLILADAQREGSWVNKRLKRRELWADNGDLSMSDSSEEVLVSGKRRRSESLTNTGAPEEKKQRKAEGEDL